MAWTKGPPGRGGPFGYDLMKMIRAATIGAVAVGWLCALATASHAAPAKGGGVLSRGWTEARLASVLRAPAEWAPFPTAAQRARWETLPDEVREACVRRGEAVRREWPEITASDTLDFQRTGRRTEFQTKYFSRRAHLQALVLAECVEGKRRFADVIADRVWSLCEESTWALPAHLGSQRVGLGLPDVTEPFLDIFAADTAGLLAWTDYLLGDTLDRVSPRLRERIALEVERRVLEPGRARTDFWWMGYDGRVPKNWNPWVCREWLAAALLLSRTAPPRADDVVKIVRTLELFIQGLPSDGSCDEGPGYWAGAAGAMFEALDLLRGATQGACDAFTVPVVREAGRYLYRVHIAGDYFVNTGDARARIALPAEIVFRYGQRIGDPRLMALGAAGARAQGFPKISGGMRLGEVLHALFAADELVAALPAARAPLLRDAWLPDLQLMTARSAEGSSAGLFLAAQAGYNGKAHNHNDTGNFVVYYDGSPVLIDLGPAEYSAKTFSDQRYDVWVNQSAWHNLPTINGVMQAAGAAYAARDVEYQASETAATLRSELAGAYPAEAGVIAWRRAVQLDRGRAVIVSDDYRLKAPTRDIVWSFVCAAEPRVVGPGRIALRPAAGDARLTLAFDGEALQAEVETVEVQDPWIREFWGDRVYRILVRRRTPVQEGASTFRIGSEAP